MDQEDRQVASGEHQEEDQRGVSTVSRKYTPGSYKLICPPQ